MVKQFSLWLLFTAFLYSLQSSFLPLVAVNGVSPDLLLLLVVSFAFLYGSRYGIWLGFVAGLLQDLASGAFFGVNVFCKLLIGYVCGSFSNRVFKEQLLLPLVAAITASAANFFLSSGFMFLLGYPPDMELLLGKYFLPVMFMNVIFALPIHFAVHRVDEALNKAEKRE